MPIDYEKRAHEVYDAIRFRDMAGDLKRTEAHLRTIAAEARREALEEAATKLRDEVDVVGAVGDTYYAQLGDGAATLRAAEDWLRKLAEESKP